MRTRVEYLQECIICLTSWFNKFTGSTKKSGHDRFPRISTTQHILPISPPPLMTSFTNSRVILLKLLLSNSLCLFKPYSKQEVAWLESVFTTLLLRVRRIVTPSSESTIDEEDSTNEIFVRCHKGPR